LTRINKTTNVSATEQLREYIYDFINRSGNAGVTDEEIAFNFDVSGDITRPRRNELVKANRVGNSGSRRPTTTGRTATIWKSTKVLQKVAKSKIR